MITLAHLTAARNAAKSHAMLLQAFVGMLALALESKDPVGAVSRKAMVRQAGAAGSHFVSQFEADMTTAVNAIVSMALHDSGAFASDEMHKQRMTDLKDYANSVLAELVASMQVVVNGNVATVMSELRKIRLNASMLQISRGMTHAGAIMKSRTGRLEEMNFTTPDSAGRKWRSGDYVTSMVSKALLQLYVEAFVYCCAVQGDTTAKVIYPTPGHENDGLVFTILGDDAGCFDNIKDAIWHPNSTAGVQRVHS